MVVDVSTKRLLDASSVIEGAPYMMQSLLDSASSNYSLKCASCQSQNCPSTFIEERYSLKCASCQSQNCPSTSIEGRV